MNEYFSTFVFLFFHFLFFFSFFLLSKVVVSAEAQCCVTAMSKHAPFSYFNLNGSRAKRACIADQNSSSQMKKNCATTAPKSQDSGNLWAALLRNHSIMERGDRS